ncbi:hypothetical protein [Streptomyces sp. NPDC001388]|uniref:hypothetical protein n=1 Tax=unclassified Streptomyces TaxID=2593676 RepID=UPI0036A98FF5
MSTLALLVAVLLGLAFVLVPGALAYLAARGPMGVGIAAVAAMAAIVIPIALR